MKTLIFGILLALAGSVYGTAEWRPLPSTTLSDLLDNKWANKAGYLSAGSIVGTAGVSWPDGRQAVHTTIEIRQVGKGYLFRCIDYYDNDLAHTDQVCYQLQEAGGD